MILQVDPKDHEPIYAQIEKGVKLAIIRGVWRPGEQIPSRRELSEDLRVNPNTVAAAYRNLAREGVVEARRGLGVFVSSDAPSLSKRFLSKILADRFARLVADAREADLDKGEMRRLLEGLLEKGTRAQEDEEA